MTIIMLMQSYKPTTVDAIIINSFFPLPRRIYAPVHNIL